MCGGFRRGLTRTIPNVSPFAKAMAFGKALYDRRVALRLSAPELAERLRVSEDEVECMEEGGVQPTLELLRRVAAALDADVRLTAGHDLGSLLFEARVA
ncbi:helix-turn-helix domain-containing protein [Streptomyces sp. BH104]|uniref:helix-turn-helix domain-containing protein n=1 Tax=Streptomyces sp. BH104 TaxID=3410407 RepID=UPI003BB66AB4